MLICSDYRGAAIGTYTTAIFFQQSETVGEASGVLTAMVFDHEDYVKGVFAVQDFAHKCFGPV